MLPREITPHVLSILAQMASEYCMCGSRVTCDPPPSDTDEDWLVLLRDDFELSVLADKLVNNGYDIEGGEHYQLSADNTFASFRNRAVNLIVTKNRDFFAKHKLATAVCAKLNLQDKVHRKTLFQAILYGKFMP